MWHYSISQMPPAAQPATSSWGNESEFRPQRDGRQSGVATCNAAALLNSDLFSVSHRQRLWKAPAAGFLAPPRFKLPIEPFHYLLLVSYCLWRMRGVWSCHGRLLEMKSMSLFEGVNSKWRRPQARLPLGPWFPSCFCHQWPMQNARQLDE